MLSANADSVRDVQSMGTDMRGPKGSDLGLCAVLTDVGVHITARPVP